LHNNLTSDRLRCVRCELLNFILRSNQVLKVRSNSDNILKLR